MLAIARDAGLRARPRAEPTVASGLFNASRSALSNTAVAMYSKTTTTTTTTTTTEAEVPSKIVLKYWNGRGLMEVNRRAISLSVPRSVP
jgi:hypothetical protein